MNAAVNFEYGDYVKCLKECYEKFGGILDLPIVGSPYEEIVKQYNRGNVLDLGAGGKKPLLACLKGKLTDGRYYSLDTDPQGKFDFRSIDEVPADLQFNLIVANQVFEHLTIDESFEMLEKAALHTTAGGKVIATVPNIVHPNRQISHITHKTPWGHNSFYALFSMCGLQPVKIARYSKRLPKGIIEKALAHYLNRLYRMDYCDSILLVATKK
jgi:hypothetical protein